MLYLTVFFTDGTFENIDATPAGLAFYLAITEGVEKIINRF